MRLLTGNNRIFTGRSRGNQNIRTFLRGRKTTREIIMILGSLIRKTTFRNISNKRTSIDAGYSSIIDGNNERVR